MGEIKIPIISVSRGHMRLSPLLSDPRIVVIMESDRFAEGFYYHRAKDETEMPVAALKFNSPRQALALAHMLIEVATEMQERADQAQEAREDTKDAKE